MSYHRLGPKYFLFLFFSHLTNVYIYFSGFILYPWYTIDGTGTGKGGQQRMGLETRRLELRYVFYFIYFLFSLLITIYSRLHLRNGNSNNNDMSPPRHHLPSLLSTQHCQRSQPPIPFTRGGSFINFISTLSPPLSWRGDLFQEPPTASTPLDTFFYYLFQPWAKTATPKHCLALFI